MTLIDRDEDEAGAFVQASILAQAKQCLEECLMLCIVGGLDKDEALDRIMECSSTFPAWEEEGHEQLYINIREWVEAAKNHFDIKLFSDSVLATIAELPEVEQ